MKFKNFRNEKTLTEAYKNLNENYAIISGVQAEDLKEYKSYKAQIVLYKGKNSTEIKEGFIVINSSKAAAEFKQDMIDLGSRYNQNNFRLYENKSNYLISTNLNPDGYPGFGKIGVHQTLDFDIFSESGELNPLKTAEKSLEEGLDIVFPTEQFFS